MSFGPLGAQTTRPVVMGRNGVVVAGHHLAAQAGLDMLKSGGNAIDAAIATAAALAVLKATGLDLPFIIVSGTIGEATAVEAMRAGAHDYVLKDNLGRLTPAMWSRKSASPIARARSSGGDRRSTRSTA